MFPLKDPLGRGMAWTASAPPLTPPRLSQVLVREHQSHCQPGPLPRRAAGELPLAALAEPRQQRGMPLLRHRAPHLPGRLHRVPAAGALHATDPQGAGPRPRHRGGAVEGGGKTGMPGQTWRECGSAAMHLIPGGAGGAPFNNLAPPGGGGDWGVPHHPPPPPRALKEWAKFSSGPSADQQFSLAPSTPIGSVKHLVK